MMWKNCEGMREEVVYVKNVDCCREGKMFNVALTYVILPGCVPGYVAESEGSNSKGRGDNSACISKVHCIIAFNILGSSHDSIDAGASDNDHLHRPTSIA